MVRRNLDLVHGYVQREGSLACMKDMHCAGCVCISFKLMNFMHNHTVQILSVHYRATDSACPASMKCRIMSQSSASSAKRRASEVSYHNMLESLYWFRFVEGAR
jgi:hypothetical protein